MATFRVLIMKKTKRQKEILDLLIYFKVKPKDIAQRLNIDRSAVYKLIRRSKRSGLWDEYQKMYSKEQCTKTYGNKIRLHAEEFNIKILWKGSFYDNLQKKGTQTYVKGHRVRLYRNSIEIYSSKDFCFFGLDTQDADRQSAYYWGGIFSILENDLRITLVKDRYQNIKRVKAHYSNIDSGLAENFNKNDEKLHIKGNDGKTWLLIDNSWHLNELETVHPINSKEDMQDIIEPLINGLRDHYEQTGEIITMDKMILAISNLTGGVDDLGRVVSKQSKVITKVLELLVKMMNINENLVPKPDDDPRYDYFG